MAVVTVLESLGAAALVFLALRSAIGTVVVPRGVPSRLTRGVFIVVRVLFDARLLVTGMGQRRSEARRDRVLVFFAPVALLALQVCWLLMVAAGFTLAGMARGEDAWAAVLGSGSSLLTLGFDTPPGHLAAILSFLEAGAGLALLTLLITYLPSLYAAFSRREHLVRKLEVRAGDPPAGAELLARAFRSRRETGLPELWRSWEDWFVDVEETHASFASLAFFRSPQRRLSWITAAGAVLDAAALLLAREGHDTGADTDQPDDAAEADPGDVIAAEVCLRSGTLALQRIGAFYGIPGLDDGRCRVSREEFQRAWDHLDGARVPARRDPPAGWETFRELRGRYDSALTGIAALVVAPAAPWSADGVGERESPPGRGRLRLRTRHVADDDTAGITPLDPPSSLTQDA